MKVIEIDDRHDENILVEMEDLKEKEIRLNVRSVTQEGGQLEVKGPTSIEARYQFPHRAQLWITSLRT